MVSLFSSFPSLPYQSLPFCLGLPFCSLLLLFLSPSSLASSVSPSLAISELGGAVSLLCLGLCLCLCLSRLILFVGHRPCLSVGHLSTVAIADYPTAIPQFGRLSRRCSYLFGQCRFFCSITSIGALLDSNLLVRSAQVTIGSYTNRLVQCGMGREIVLCVCVFFSFIM